MKKRLISTISIVTFILIISIAVLADKVIDQDNLDIIDAAQKAQNGKAVVAVVNGVEIYGEMIDFLATGEEIALKNSNEYTGEEATPQNVDTDKILNDQIRNAVVLSEAKSLGLEATEKEAEEYTLENYELVKELNDENYQFISDYRKEMDLSEEEYIKLCTEANINKLTRANLYNNFVKDKTGTYDELVTEYEKYVDELIKKADIEYK